MTNCKHVHSCLQQSDSECNAVSSDLLFHPLYESVHANMQSHIAAYLRSALSIIKPHLGPLLAKASWGQQLAAQTPGGLPRNPSTHDSTPHHSPSQHRSSSPKSNEHNYHTGSGGKEVAGVYMAQGAEPTQTAVGALKGVFQLGWLLLCRTQLTKAWQANFGHAQLALETGSSGVSACTALRPAILKPGS